MNKAILLVLVLAVAIASATSIDCLDNGACSGNGAQCGTVNQTGANPGAQTTYFCNFNSWCDTSKPINGNKGTCTANLAAGAACSIFDGSCGNNLFCNTTSGTSGTCVAQTYTVAQGGNCTQANACAAGSTCQYNATLATSVCVAISPVTGASCTSLCADASSCIGGTCVAWGSVAAGSTCTQTVDCAPGNYCGGTCTAGFSSSNAACGTGATPVVCAKTGEGCACANQGSSQDQHCVAPPTYSSGDISALKNFFTCKNGQCPQAQDLFACGKCNSQACTYAGIATRGELTYSCGSPCGSGAALVASMVFVAVAAFFAL